MKRGVRPIKKLPPSETVAHPVPVPPPSGGGGWIRHSYPRFHRGLPTYHCLRQCIHCKVLKDLKDLKDLKVIIPKMPRVHRRLLTYHLRKGWFGLGIKTDSKSQNISQPQTSSLVESAPSAGIINLYIYKPRRGCSQGTIFNLSEVGRICFGYWVPGCEHLRCILPGVGYLQSLRDCSWHSAPDTRHSIKKHPRRDVFYYLALGIYHLTATFLPLIT